MPPELTETWGAAYLQVLIVLLVFALGIPSLIFQILVPEDIRRITHSRAKTTWWYSFLFMLMIADLTASLLLIWFLHPHGEEYVPAWKSYAASVAVTVIILSVTLFWWLHLGGRGRKSLVDTLEGELRKTYHKNGFLKEKTLADLVYLGEQGKPGYEKALVLDALNRLVSRIQGSAQYEGVELELIIRSFETILGNNERLGTDENFCSAANRLKSLLTRLSKLGMSSSQDAYLALRMLKQLGTIAINKKSDATSLTFLEASTGESNTLFEMGVSAITVKKFFIATAALNKLEKLAEPKQESSNEETTSHLLGLISHFRGASISSRKRAESSLNILAIDCSPSMKDCLSLAIEHHYSNCNFETADGLVDLLERLESKA